MKYPMPKYMNDPNGKQHLHGNMHNQPVNETTHDSVPHNPTMPNAMESAKRLREKIKNSQLAMADIQKQLQTRQGPTGTNKPVAPVPQNQDLAGGWAAVQNLQNTITRSQQIMAISHRQLQKRQMIDDLYIVSDGIVATIKIVFYLLVLAGVLVVGINVLTKI